MITAGRIATAGLGQPAAEEAVVRPFVTSQRGALSSSLFCADARSQARAVIAAVAVYRVGL